MKPGWRIYDRTSRLWWSNTDGWTCKQMATVFTTKEMLCFRAIPGTSSEWRGKP